MKEIAVSVIGLGYVGLPVAVEMAKKYKTVGFDINPERIAELKSGIDRTNEVDTSDLLNENLAYTSDGSSLRNANFHIVAVPTPIDGAKQPDLSSLIRATKVIGEQLKKGDIVVYESTVFPGATEDYCVPLLQDLSGLKYKSDFFVGYSPERINPGDKEHSFTNIKKVVSGCNKEALDIISQVYGEVVTAGIFKADSIKVAEAAKVIENTQRDLNIAFMNELAVIFDKMGLDTLSVLEAASTKWNFLNFKPGLVGGHCIGVDPYYLTHKAESLKYHPEVILSGRKINDNMGCFIAEKVIKKIIKSDKPVKGTKVAILGLTFKENCPDLRNTKVIDIIEILKDYGVDVSVTDAEAMPSEAKSFYGIDLVGLDELKDMDAFVLAVGHNSYKALKPSDFKEKAKKNFFIYDVKGTLHIDNFRDEDINVVRL